MIDIHYAKIRLVQRWDWNRYLRLCGFLRMTPSEVASLVLMPHCDIPNFEKSNRLVRTRARPIAMLLTLLEARCYNGMTADVIENPFPNLNTLSDALPSNP